MPVGRIDRDGLATLAVPALGLSFKAQLSRVRDYDTRTYRIELSEVMPAVDLPLRPGMSAVARIPLAPQTLAASIWSQVFAPLCSWCATLRTKGGEHHVRCSWVCVSRWRPFNNTSDARILSAMAAQIAYRGPDAETTHIWNSVVSSFGASPSSIWRLATSLSSTRAARWCSWRTERFSTTAPLRDELKSAHHFRSASDCELPLHAYEDFGCDASASSMACMPSCCSTKLHVSSCLCATG